MTVPIVVCTCGIRLRAPGARPGRIGRCPGCGAPLRIPDGPPPAGPSPPPPGPGRRPRRPESTARVEVEGFFASHAYPVRNADGAAYLLIMTAVWWGASLGPFLMAASMMVGDPLSELAKIAFVPSLVGLPPVLAYALTYLGRAFTETLAGEDGPPRWPDLDVWEQLRALALWTTAALAGAVVGGVPAWLFWSQAEAPGILDQGAVAAMALLGAIYAETALATGLAFEDPLAMNPWTVSKAIRRLGLGLLRPLLVAAPAAALGVATLRLAMTLTSPLASTACLAGFWALATYEALVATRILGLECRRRSRSLGWFREPGPAAGAGRPSSFRR